MAMSPNRSPEDSIEGDTGRTEWKPTVSGRVAKLDSKPPHRKDMEVVPEGPQTACLRHGVNSVNIHRMGVPVLSETVG